ncbi:MAG TPA: response regulator [Rhodocyclaceae bacterium]
MAQIMVVDDEVGIRQLLSEILADEGHDVWLAENAATARKLRASRRPDLVLLDIWMPDTDGISLLKEWSASGALTMPVVMMSGHGTIDTAVEATRIGAADFLEKPIALQKLLSTVQKSLRHVVATPASDTAAGDLRALKGMRDLVRRIEQAATRSPAILLKGGNPWLAELCARVVHSPQTPWRNLGNGDPLTQEVLESLAGGVLFVGDLAQLGKLQQKNVAFALERVARHRILFIAGSSRPAEQLVEAGWEENLVQRLGEVWVDLPPLAAHVDDIPELATTMLQQLVARGDVPVRRLSSAALNAMRLHRWPGDWSELQAAVRHLALAALDEVIDDGDVQALVGSTAPAADATDTALSELFEMPLREARDAFEKRYFEHLLRRESGNMTRLAERCGLERTHLYRKLKQLGVATGRRGEAEGPTASG